MTVRKIGEKAVTSPLKRFTLLVMAALFFFSVTAFAVPPVMYDVTIYDGESVVVVSTAETDASKVLENAGITVNEAYGDSVSFTNFTGEDGSAIIIRRGVKVTINSFDGTSHTICTSGTVGDALKAAGITLPRSTALNYAAGDLLEDGMVIEIYDLYDVVIKADGKTLEKNISGETVADALALSGIVLSEEDFTVPSKETALKDGMEIEVFRVTVKERTETEELEYETETSYDSSIYKNEKKVVKEGVNGSKAIVYQDRYVNGELNSSTVLSEDVVLEPVNEVVKIGTKEKPVASKPVASAPVKTYPSTLPIGTPISELAVPSYLTIGSNGIPTNYSSVINAKATAYCIPGGTTSTGKRAQTGYIAVDPKEIPYGTEMYIVSADGRYVYGYCIAADTGSYINDVDWTVDLYMNSEAQCVNWGRRDVIIYVL
ncbi:MAG: G5 domain-containing protein [Clostridia bacterium]|nr:G5 domain-containing protein [Clostridia bacterium]